MEKITENQGLSRRGLENRRRKCLRKSQRIKGLRIVGHAEITQDQAPKPFVSHATVSSPSSARRSCCRRPARGSPDV
ncbi:hypothetical protein Dimus_015577, partial [Dionaea muscipula]